MAHSRRAIYIIFIKGNHNVRQPSSYISSRWDMADNFLYILEPQSTVIRKTSKGLQAEYTSANAVKCSQKATRQKGWQLSRVPCVASIYLYYTDRKSRLYSRQRGGREEKNERRRRSFGRVSVGRQIWRPPGSLIKSFIIIIACIDGLHESDIVTIVPLISLGHMYGQHAS